MTASAPAATGKEPKPFIWTAQAKDILAKVARARTKLNRRRSNIK